MAQSKPLKRSTPESQGVSSKNVLEFINALEENCPNMHSVMLLRHGQVIAEAWWTPFAPDRPHMLYSLSKSFTSTAIGMAVDEGRLSVDDTVLSFFPEEAAGAAADKNLRAMKVRHLLSMSTGHDQDTSQRTFAHRNWVKAFLSLPVEHEPGTHFCYNTAATYMLSAILQKITGEKLMAYLRPRLFEPLGIRGAKWESCPMGINIGGFGLSVKTEDIARFGQLYLNKGVWNGRRLVSEAWIEEATRAQVPNGDDPHNDWNQGYGYQFWRCRHNAYRGDGAFGQYCIVMPEQDAVLAITSGVKEMQPTLNYVWDCLLPAMKAGALTENPVERRVLARALGEKRYDPPAGATTSPTAEKVSGRTITFANNELKLREMTYTFSGQGARLKLALGRRVFEFDCGLGEWAHGKSAMLFRSAQRVAASGVWTAPDTFETTLRFYESPYTERITCRFTGEGALVKAELNVSFGPTEWPELEGRFA